MKKILSLLLMIVTIITYGQQQGTYYFTSEGIPCNIKETKTKLELYKIDSNNYKEIIYHENDINGAVPDSYTLYRFENDSVCTIRLLKDKRLNNTTKRTYQKLNDSLYTFTDFLDTIVIRKGFSYSILPLIFEGKIDKYFADGKKKSEEIYSKNKLIANQHWNSSGEKEMENLFEMKQVDIKPTFMNGDLSTFISKRLKYPKISAKNLIEGDVYIQFIIKEDGSIDQLKVIQSVDPFIDKEALRLIKLTNKKWIPASINNKAVKVYFNMRVPFKL